jgi:hypothetical protein
LILPSLTASHRSYLGRPQADIDSETFHLAAAYLLLQRSSGEMHLRAQRAESLAARRLRRLRGVVKVAAALAAVDDERPVA